MLTGCVASTTSVVETSDSVGASESVGCARTASSSAPTRAEAVVAVRGVTGRYTCPQPASNELHASAIASLRTTSSPRSRRVQ
jgi:hypothetical protein